MSSNARSCALPGPVAALCPILADCDCRSRRLCQGLARPRPMQISANKRSAALRTDIAERAVRSGHSVATSESAASTIEPGCHGRGRNAPALRSKDSVRGGAPFRGDDPVLMPPKMPSIVGCGGGCIEDRYDHVLIRWGLPWSADLESTLHESIADMPLDGDDCGGLRQICPCACVRCR